MRRLLAALAAFIALNDASGATEEGTIVRDENGYVVQLIDPDGAYLTILNDASGNALQVLDELGEVLVDFSEEAPEEG